MFYKPPCPGAAWLLNCGTGRKNKADINTVTNLHGWRVNCFQWELLLCVTCCKNACSGPDGRHSSMEEWLSLARTLLVHSLASASPATSVRLSRYLTYFFLAPLAWLFLQAAVSPRLYGALTVHPLLPPSTLYSFAFAV